MNRDDSQKDLFPDAPIWYEGLTGRRRLFVEYFCTDKTCYLNATAAFIKAYSKNDKELIPTDTSVQSNSARLMRDPKIKTAIAKLLRARQNEQDHLNEFKMLELLQTLAFYNPDDIVSRYGSLKKDLGELGDLALCVAGIKQTRSGIEVKLYDRTKAIDMLSRYLELIRPQDGIVNIDPHIYIAGKDVDGMRPAAAVPTAEDAEYEVVQA